MAYQRPMVTVDQNLTVTPTSIERDQPAFVFGPNFELHRYGNSDEKPDTRAIASDGSEVTYAGKAVSFPYPNVVDADKVDAGYTKLYGENVVVELAKLTGVDGHAELPEAGNEKSADEVSANGGYTKLIVAAKDFVESSSSDGYDGLAKKLAAGDKVAVSYKLTGVADARTFVTEVKDVKYSSTSWNIDDDSSSEGPSGTLIVIEDAVPVSDVVDGAAKALDTASVQVSLVAVVPYVEFTRKNEAAYAAGGTNPGYQWTQGEVSDAVYGTYKGITVNELNASVTAGYFSAYTFCKVLFADLYVEYRELNTGYADTIHAITGGASKVADTLGTVDPDNPLAMGVYMACLNAQTDDGTESAPVYFMATPTNDKDGYDAVLSRAATTDRVYVFAPTTNDPDVLEAVKAHVVKYSSKEEKLWRIAAGSAAVPTTETLLSAADSTAGKDFLAIPVSDQGVAPAEGRKFDKFRIVISSTDIGGNRDVGLRGLVREGDIVKFRFRDSPWAGDPQMFDTYRVTAVMNNYTVQVATDASGIDTTGLVAGSESYTPTKVEIYHEYTQAETADLISSISRKMASRRMLNVFPTDFESNGVLMGGEFAACAVAGLISATEPQQPITNMAISGIDGIPLTYRDFNKSELDTMAAGGTFIVAQDLPGDVVYVRHQITTAYPDGNLNTAELSITKNIDSISYAFAEAFRPYYGKYNITQDLLSVLYATASGLISELSGSTSLYGPQIVGENTEILFVRQNETMKDHVDIGIRLGVPYPCNVIEIVLTV